MRSKGMSVHLDTVIMNRWGYYEKNSCDFKLENAKQPDDFMAVG